MAHLDLVPKTTRLRQKIVWAWSTAALLIAAIIAIGVFFLIQSHRLALESATERATSQSFLVSEWIDKSFELTKFVLQDTASRFDASELTYPTNDPILHEQKTQLLLSKVSRTPNMLFLGMFNHRCIVTHTTIGINLGFDGIEHQREYCTLALSEPLHGFKLSNMFVSVDNIMNVTLSYPLISPTGELQGFVLAGLDLSFFQRWLDLISPENHNTITLYDLNSRMLARNPAAPERIGSHLSEPHLNRMAASESEKHFSHRLVSPVDGIDRVWSLRRIGELPFIVIVGEPTHTALQSWRQLLYLFVIAGSLMCGAILFGTREYILNLYKTAALQQLARTDALTGVANRRSFNELAEKNIALSSRSGLSLCFLMLDIDHFKSINDRFGHDVGDQVLICIANLLTSLSRQSDLIARWGGEEFMLLLPDTKLSQAITFAERLATQLAQLPLQIEQKITISQGITHYQSGETLEEIIKRTDNALYRAKERGRNRIELG